MGISRAELRQYLLVTGNYWAFTLTDGALRMLVVLHFHQLGYGPLAIAMLFLFYEFFGVVTNLVGGWLGARIGLNRTMNIGLSMQVLALLMLTLPATMLTVPWVMFAQALSGIAKDLNKMSAKSSVKQLARVADQQGESRLFRAVAILTGSKNTLKGVGFFLGGALLGLFGFTGALWGMIAMLALVLLSSLILLRQDLGRSKARPKFSEMFSTSTAVNYLSAARLFLFGARDIWFVVALPVYLSQQFDWDHWQVGGFMASWVIGYGLIQAIAPWLTGKKQGAVPGKRITLAWVASLSLIPLLIAQVLPLAPELVLVGGLLIFGACFAINSSLHSYLIVSYAREEGTSMDVGFYYMANAAGRLLGTVLSGALFQWYGLEACLIGSTLMLLVATGLTAKLPECTHGQAA
ncbi:MAG: organoarsenical effux MFS transporter ArsJ [Marinobacterium sp.]|nr:organoarsenical effux MFS transporter ArsJ [Marinobacterium sp.]